MFEYLFPIFAFGLVVTGIVYKGVLAASEVAKADRLAKVQSCAAPAEFPAFAQPLVKPGTA